MIAPRAYTSMAEWKHTVCKVRSWPVPFEAHPYEAAPSTQPGDGRQLFFPSGFLRSRERVYGDLAYAPFTGATWMALEPAAPGGVMKGTR
jgi:hypothetical protein